MTPITFTLTPADMLAGNRLALRRHLRKTAPRYSVVVLAAALGVTLLAYAFNPQPMAVISELFAKIITLYVFVAALCIGYVAYIVPQLRAKRNMAQIPALSRPQTAEWDDTTISFVSEYGHTKLPLTDLYQWAINDAVLILYPADHIFYCIPRHCITDTTSLDRLMAAIRQAGIKQI